MYNVLSYPLLIIFPYVESIFEIRISQKTHRENDFKNSPDANDFMRTEIPREIVEMRMRNLNEFSNASPAV